ncbi:DUF5954 family protein [Streptomyces sp. cg28]|uniref:DUF5954 family protein n=1 Tax=Streptomyces sp. cg28 TaxID=3403457 RepID=UPI003B21D207
MSISGMVASGWRQDGFMNPEGEGWVLPVTVAVPAEPLDAVREADAFDSVTRYSRLAVRGPLFGVAAHSGGARDRWRVVREVASAEPQDARDGLNSLLWFKAKDEAKDRAERRALLAAVKRLETEPVDELTVLGVRYRVVRADEYAAMGDGGAIEEPWATDPEPHIRDWAPNARSAPIDDALELDPEAPLTPVMASERLALRTLAYAGQRYPDAVLRDSAQAVQTHPDVLVLPALFRLVQRSGADSWSVSSRLFATPHDVRRILDFSLVWWGPRERGFISHDIARDVREIVDARTLVADGTHPELAELKELAEAADRLRAAHLNQVEVGGQVHRVVRARRLVRWGPDGPEGLRPSDVSEQGPTVIHPRLDEDGVIHHEEAGSDDSSAGGPAC